MSLNSIFQYFVPKDKKFFPLFESASANLIKMSELLVEAVNETDLERRNQIIKQIEDLEHVGDDITHKIFLELSSNFITPFDREDIHQLASAIDDIADYIHGSANRMYLYQLKKTNDSIRKLAELIAQGCQDVNKGIHELKDLKNIRNVTDSCVRIFISLSFCSACIEQCDDDVNDGYNSKVNYIYFKIIGTTGFAYDSVKLLENNFNYDNRILYNNNYSIYYYPFAPTNHFIFSGPIVNDTILLSDISYYVSNHSICGVSISVSKPTLSHTFDSLRIKYDSYYNSYELTVYTP